MILGQAGYTMGCENLLVTHRWRGRLNTMVQTGTFIGLVCASAINVGTNHLIWGWRLSLGLAAVPGGILLLGAFFFQLELRLLLYALLVTEGGCKEGLSVASTLRKQILRLRRLRSCGGAWR